MSLHPVCPFDSATLCFRGKHEEGEITDPIICHVHDSDYSDTSDEEIRQNLEHYEKPKPLTVEETVSINLGDAENPREVKIEAKLPKDVAERLKELLKNYQDIFAWSYADMPGFDRSIVEHCLSIDPSFKPKKQKQRKAKPELAKKIEEEVMKLIDVGFIEVTQYPTWVANIVPVLKKDGRVRVCVDYRDLNKASPKDDFPLPHIDVLVDSTARFELFLFMDGFSSYNQILMNEEDKEKTAFTTPWGVFHYKVMPFGLKNPGATYQRAMVTLFHDMMHKKIEVYVDDMIAKTRCEEDHVETLTKLFERLQSSRCVLTRPGAYLALVQECCLGLLLVPKALRSTHLKWKLFVSSSHPQPSRKFEVSWAD